MAKYDNQNHPFIYDRTTGEKIPVSKEVRDAYYGEAARIRMKEQAHGRCVCPQSKVWACDGDCLICEYRRSGDLASLDVPVGEDGEEMEKLDAMLSDVKFTNYKERTAQIAAFLEKYIPDVAAMETQMKKYQRCFTTAESEKKALKKKNDDLTEALEKSQQQSTVKKLQEARLQSD